MNSKKRAGTENVSVACLDVKEHKAEPRRRMERPSGIKTPDVPRREALEFLCSQQDAWQQPGLCQVSFVQPNPVNS